METSLCQQLFYEQVKDDIELLVRSWEWILRRSHPAGELTPCPFWIRFDELSADFLRLSSLLQNHTATRRPMEKWSTYGRTSGFVLKSKANMDPRHRDRLPLCGSNGEFERGIRVNLLVLVREPNFLILNLWPKAVENVSNAVAGRYHRGLRYWYLLLWLEILWQWQKQVWIWATANLTPEIFMKVSAKNVMKQNPSNKAIEQLRKKVIQPCYQPPNRWIHAWCCWSTQFEVFKHRMENNTMPKWSVSPMGKKRPFAGPKPEGLDERMSSSRNIWRRNRFDQPVFPSLKTTLPSAGLRISIQTLSWEEKMG